MCSFEWIVALLPWCSSVYLCLWQACIVIIRCTLAQAPCGLWGCGNRAHSVSWLEVVKAIPNQGLDCFVSWGSFFCFSFVFLVYVCCVWLFLVVSTSVIDLPGKTRLRNDLLCVEWDVKPYTLTHISTDISFWLDSPMFWAPWHKSMSTSYSQPFFSSAWLHGPWGAFTYVSPLIFENFHSPHIFHHHHPQ